MEETNDKKATYEGKIWKQGSSLLVTIPKNVKLYLNAESQDVCEISLKIVRKKVKDQLGTNGGN